jgi:hypothetical protein
MYIVKAECNDCFYLNHNKHRRHECIDEPGCVGKRIWQADKDIKTARKQAARETLQNVANTMAMVMSLPDDESQVCCCSMECYNVRCVTFWKSLLSSEDRYINVDRLIERIHDRTALIIEREGGKVSENIRGNSGEVS